MLIEILLAEFALIYVLDQGVSELHFRVTMRAL